MLGKSPLDFVPSRVIRWIVGRSGEIHDRGVDMKWRILCEWGPVANYLNIVPVDTIEEGKSCENAEYAEEVKSEFPVSPWDEDCPDSAWGSCGQDGGTHASRHSNHDQSTYITHPFWLNGPSRG